MKRISLILAVAAISCVLFSQFGCEEAAKAPAQTEPIVESQAKTAAVAQNVPADTQPKPEQEKTQAVAEKVEPAAVAPKPVAVTPKPVAVTPKPVEVTPKPMAVTPKPAAQTPAPKPKPEGPAPRIKFEKLIHDLGDIDPGSTNDCEFPFKNVGEAQLKIIDVKPDCGCTLYTLEKREYEPGEGGTLKLKYHAVGRASAVTRRVVVTTNDPVEPIINLTIKGRVVERVTYEPKKLNLLLKGGDDKLPEVTLRSLDGKAFSIKSVKSSGNAVSAEFDPAVEATKFVLQLKVDKAQLQKVSNGIVEFDLTHPGAENVTITFSALTRFRLNPPTIILFDAEPGKPVLRDNVVILNNYEEDFEIASVKSATGITKVVKQESIRYGYQFSLEVTPPDSGGKQRFTDDISIQVKDGELFTIKCQGFYTRKKI